jgi:hypothetical protein
MFERYTTRRESDRSLADWLNAKGARTARDRSFSKDTVREMLCNAAYAGYVSGLRDKTRAIQGLHEAIVTDELFEKVQEIRSWRTRVVKPGRPSEEYLLRKLLCCERCGARITAPAAHAPASAATSAPPAATTATAPKRSSRPSRWRTSSLRGSTPSSRTPSCAISSSTRSALPHTSTLVKISSAAATC